MPSSPHPKRNPASEQPAKTQSASDAHVAFVVAAFVVFVASVGGGARDELGAAVGDRDGDALGDRDGAAVGLSEGHGVVGIAVGRSVSFFPYSIATQPNPDCPRAASASHAAAHRAFDTRVCPVCRSTQRRLPEHA